MANLIPFPEPDAEAHARAETERKRKLFVWAEALLQLLGLTAKVAQAQSVDDLRKITLDVDDVEVAFAIRDALHPAGGPRSEHFTGVNAGTLKRLLKKRLAEMKKDREAELLGRSGAARAQRASPLNWINDLKLDAKGGVRPILANLILFLREHWAWKGVLAFDEFNARVVIRKRPDWGDELPDAPWTDHHESLVRVWFQNEDIAANQSDVGRAVQAAARSNSFHPVRDYFDALVWDGKPRIDTLLSAYLHADDTPYARAIGPRFLISAVARIYTPGCKVDHVLVLEGPQGKQKSEALRTLAVRDAWFTDRLSHVTSKDAAQEMAGVWLIEIAENGSANSGDGVLDQVFHYATVRSVPAAIRKTSDQSATAMRVRGQHQSGCRRLPEGPDRCTANLASGVPGHDRYRGASARPRSTGPKPLCATKQVGNGGWRRPNWKLSLPLSKRHVTRPMSGKSRS